MREIVVDTVTSLESDCDGATENVCPVTLRVFVKLEVWDRVCDVDAEIVVVVAGESERLGVPFENVTVTVFVVVVVRLSECGSVPVALVALALSVDVLVTVLVSDTDMAWLGVLVSVLLGVSVRDTDEVGESVLELEPE